MSRVIHPYGQLVVNCERLIHDRGRGSDCGHGCECGYMVHMHILVPNLPI